MNSHNEGQPWRALYEMSRDLHQYQQMDPAGILDYMLQRLGDVMQLRTGCILTFDENGEIDEAITLNNGSTGPAIWEILYSRGLIGFVHHSQRTIVIRDITTDPRWPALQDDTDLPETGSAIGIPLRIDEKPVGVMIFIHPNIDAFDNAAVTFLEEAGILISEAATNEARQRDMRDQGERYQWLFEDAITPVLITDMTGTIIASNKEANRILKYQSDTLIGMSITEIHRPQKGVSGLSGGSPLETNRLSMFETTIWNANSDMIPVRLKRRKRVYKGRAVIEWVMQDISTQMALEQLRNDLTAMVYHDLRGPIQNIKFSLSALKRMLPEGNQKTEAILNAAQRSTLQLSRMVSSLLDIQRLEAGKAILNRSETPMRRIVGAAVDQTRPIVAAANCQFKLNVARDLPVMNVDVDMIRRVMTNLIENATKYAADGGQVTLDIFQESDDRMHIIVADDGPGIPPEMKQRIFDKFSRVKHEGSPQGVGLGLAFCRLAVDAHHGQIWVESELGHGAAFHVVLPVEPALQGRDEILNGATRV